MSNKQKVERDEFLSLISDCILELKKYPFSKVLDAISQFPLLDVVQVLNNLQSSGVKPSPSRPVGLGGITNIKEWKAPSENSQLKVMTKKEKEHFYVIFQELWGKDNYHGNLDLFKSHFEKRIAQEFPMDMEKQNLYMAFCEMELKNILDHMSFNINTVKEEQDKKNTLLVVDFINQIQILREGLIQNQIDLDEKKINNEQLKAKNNELYFTSSHAFINLYNEYLEPKEEEQKEIDPSSVILDIFPCPECGDIPAPVFVKGYIGTDAVVHYILEGEDSGKHLLHKCGVARDFAYQIKKEYYTREEVVVIWNDFVNKFKKENLQADVEKKISLTAILKLARVYRDQADKYINDDKEDVYCYLYFGYKDNTIISHNEFIGLKQIVKEEGFKLELSTGNGLKFYPINKETGEMIPFQEILDKWSEKNKN